MFDNPSLETAFAILRMTMQRPLGLISVVLFLGGIAAFLIFRDLNPKASVTSFWFVLIGCAGLAYEASETMRLNPDLTRFRRAALVAASPDARPVPPPATSGNGVSPNPGRTLPGGSTAPPSSSAGGSTSGSGVSGGGGSAPAGGTANPSGTKSASDGRQDGEQNQTASSADPSEADKSRTFSSIQWVTHKVVSEERVTGNHKCADVPGAFNPRACKTGYTISLTCEAGKRLTAPQLHCLEGDCAASEVHEIRIAPDGRRIDARFEVWGTSTRWQLTAVREESTTPNP
jgi:hypothetical protein